MLSLTDEAKATANKERLDKICQTLGEAYHLGNLRLQTEPWQDDKGWETPVMRRKRIQEEGRQQAQDLLEADTTAQKILQTFEAQWLPSERQERFSDGMSEPIYFKPIGVKYVRKSRIRRPDETGSTNAGKHEKGTSQAG